MYFEPDRYICDIYIPSKGKSKHPFIGVQRSVPNSNGFSGSDGLAYDINKTFSYKILRKIRQPTNVFDENWDNLIILDGCRYDILQNYRTEFGGGKFSWRWSGGSNSMKFLEHNVIGNTLNDVIWVTANPWVSRLSEVIYKVKNIWSTDWNENFNTVMPDTMQRVASNVSDDNPNKRIVIHFMQPHYPFIGSTGQNELPNHRTYTGNGLIMDNGNESRSIWDHLEKGNVSRNLVWEAYKENLEEVINPVKQLISNLSGKTVVTSDHGNAFGERAFPIPKPIYGHPGGLHYKPLVKVPWVNFDYNMRRTIKKETINECGQNINGSDVGSRLENLGYRMK